MENLSGPTPYPLVECVWDDAETNGGWDKVPEPKQSLVLTVGFLIKETENHLVICHSITDSEYGTNGRIQIPRGMIVHRKQL